MASAELDIIFQAKNQAKGVIADLERDLGSLDKQSRGMASRTMKALGTIAKAGAVAAAGASIVAGAAYVKTAKDGVKMAYSLEDQMYAIAAVMGKTRDEIMPLDKIITDLGLNPNLKVTTQEAADVMEMLAKNGLTRLADAGGNLEDVFGSAALTTIQLSNATGGDMAEAAGVATDALWQFNMAAEDMGKVADQATGVVNFSKADFEDYKFALAAVGGVAGAVGVEFGDMNTALAQIIPNFSGGQTAGTAMKQFLISLVPKSAAAGDAMEKLGLDFFDAQGNMKSMAEITDELNQAFYQAQPVFEYQNQLTEDQARQLDALQKSYAQTSADLADYQAGIKGADLSDEKRKETINDLNDQMAFQQKKIAELDAARGDLTETTRKLSEEERLTYLHDIFGTRAFIVAQGLAKITGAEFEDLYGTITQGGLASEAAATRMQSLAGATEIFGGVFESIKIQAGMKYLDGLKDAVKEATVTLSFAAPFMIEALGAPANVIENRLVPSLKNLNAILEAGGVTFNLADIVNFTWDWKNDKYKLDLGTIASFTAQMVPEGGIKLAINDQDIDTSSVKAALLSSLDALGLDLATVTPDKMAEAAGALVGSFSAQVVIAAGAVGESAAGMAEAAQGLIDGFVTQVQGLATVENAVGLADAATALANTFVLSMTASFVTALPIATLTSGVEMAVAAQGLIDGFVAQVQSLATVENAVGLADAAQSLIDNLGAQVVTLATGETATGMTEAAQGLVDGFVAQVKGLATAEDVVGLGEAALSLVESLGSQIVAATTGETATGMADAAQGLVKQLGDNVTAYFDSPSWAQTKTNVSLGLAGLGDTIALVLSPDGLVGGAVQSGIDFIGTLSTEVSELDPAKAGESLNGILEFVTGLVGSVKGFEMGTQAQAFSAVTDLVTNLLNLTADTGAELDPDLLANMAKDMLTGLSNEIQTALSDEKSLALGDAAGSLVRTFATKLTEVLSSPDLGKDMGQATGEGAGALATAAANLVTGFATQIADTDWAALSASVSSFTGDFLAQFASALGDVDWSPVAQALLDSLGNAVVSLLGGTVGKFGVFGAGANDQVAQMEALGLVPPGTKPATFADLTPPSGNWFTRLFGGGGDTGLASMDSVMNVPVTGDVVTINTDPLAAGEPEVQIIGQISEVKPPSTGEPEVEIVGKVTKANLPKTSTWGWSPLPQGTGSQASGGGSQAPAVQAMSVSGGYNPLAGPIDWGVPPPLEVDVPPPLEVDVPDPLEVKPPSEPGWISSLMSWAPPPVTVSVDVNVTGAGGGSGGFGGGGDTPPTEPTTPPNGNGSGPPFALGGRTRGGSFLAGEMGPELVATAGPAYVFTADETDQILNQRGNQVIIQATINTPVDVEELSYLVADKIRRRGRR